MNNQSKLAKILFKAMKEKNDKILNEKYPLYIRYVKFLGKGEADYNLLSQVKTNYADYKIIKYAKNRHFLEWTEKDAIDLANDIKETLK